MEQNEFNQETRSIILNQLEKELGSFALTTFTEFEAEIQLFLNGDFLVLKIENDNVVSATWKFQGVLPCLVGMGGLVEQIWKEIRRKLRR